MPVPSSTLSFLTWKITYNRYGSILQMGLPLKSTISRRGSSRMWLISFRSEIRLFPIYSSINDDRHSSPLREVIRLSSNDSWLNFSSMLIFSMVVSWFFPISSLDKRVRLDKFSMAVILFSSKQSSSSLTFWLSPSIFCSSLSQKLAFRKLLSPSMCWIFPSLWWSSSISTTISFQLSSDVHSRRMSDTLTRVYTDRGAVMRRDRAFLVEVE
mmetsp:Transcript_46192/g.90975  ORF Transcript_46192/g.90975 Transcript_46192/m.90975 type:complete len:212 (+) Transcript_46192:1464-2099(+)